MLINIFADFAGYREINSLNLSPEVNYIQVKALMETLKIQLEMQSGWGRHYPKIIV